MQRERAGEQELVSVSPSIGIAVLICITTIIIVSVTITNIVVVIATVTITVPNMYSESSLSIAVLRTLQVPSYLTLTTTQRIRYYYAHLSVRHLCLRVVKRLALGHTVNDRLGDLNLDLFDF